jgi:hypothetical protein
MVDYVKLAATTQRLIDNNGRTFQFVLKGSAVDPAKPWDGNADGSTESAKGVFLSYSRREIDGTKIQAEDKRLVVAAQNLSADLTTAIKVRDGGTDYQVVGPVRVVQPGDVVLLYEIQARA